MSPGVIADDALRHLLLAPVLTRKPSYSPITARRPPFPFKPIPSTGRMMSPQKQARNNHGSGGHSLYGTGANLAGHIGKGVKQKSTCRDGSATGVSKYE